MGPVLFLCAMLGQADADLQPVPSLTALVGARKLIEDVYGRRIEAAKAAAQKAAVGQEILAVAEKEQNQANRYAGLQVAKRLAVEAENGKLGLAVVKRFASEFQPPLPREADAWLPAAETAWDAAESKKGTDRLAGRLDAAECWLRAGKSSAIGSEKWGKRFATIETGADVVLWARDSQPKGDRIAYAADLDVIFRWSNASDYIEWKAFLPAGKYSITIEYTAGKDMVPHSVLGLAIGASGASRSIHEEAFSLERTGAFPTFVLHQMSDVAVIRSDGEYIIRLGVLKKSPARSWITIVNIRSIRLSQK